MMRRILENLTGYNYYFVIILKNIFYFNLKLFIYRLQINISCLNNYFQFRKLKKFNFVKRYIKNTLNYYK
ncbi:MAG: hypothetical protein Q8844_02230 [Pigeon pea little leaf phytoplasma]|uniref:hypothetical protein n=1 Tax=Candidatus Phytoplasma fabacearum TaxID=2982628 RepID=UPI00293B8603|nr:hypothetical protein [Pigeon pea little leaf phytoplasma]MDV3200457.1 hypothetical protein [Pigeon pea little leaf phytoplasma]